MAQTGPIAREHSLAHHAFGLTDIGFLIILGLVFITLTPFAGGSAVTSHGSGSLLRQISYLAAFGLISVAAWQKRGLGMFTSIPPILLLLLIWCCLSALWSIAPFVSLRRAALLALVTLAIVLSLQNIGLSRCLSYLRIILAAVLLINLTSILFIPQAVHLSGEIDADLVGNWRGLYVHKNIAGGISAMTALLFFFATLETRKAIPALLCLGAVFFAVMTQSKTSLAILPIAALAGVVYYSAWARALDRHIALVTLGLLGLIALAVITSQWDHLTTLLGNPTELTGRTAIWRAELAYIADHPWLGSGFGSFADSGTKSPLAPYINETWLQAIAHGHSGYLQILVTIGLPGFILAMTVFIFQPCIAFWRGTAEQRQVHATLFALFSFVLLHNLLESDFLETDGPAWVCFLIVLAGLYPNNNHKSSHNDT